MTSRFLAALLLLGLAGCKGAAEPPLPAIDALWSDDFERDEIGDDYNATADVYRISNGALSAKGAHNRPLWLRRPLPANAKIELDCWSNSSDGDIKIEIYGDGKSFDPDQGSYTSTGYVLIMGGWKNSKSIIARMDEHGKNLAERAVPKVEKGRRYHWTVSRNGGQIDWLVDGQPFLSFRDAAPLSGANHAFLGFDNWESDVWFDNLTVEPL